MRVNESVIIKEVSDYFHMPTDTLKMKSRKGEIIKARHIAMYLCCYYTPLTLVAIGGMFNQDHATVLNAKKSVMNQRDTNKYYNLIIVELIEMLKRYGINERLIDDEVFMLNDCFNN